VNVNEDDETAGVTVSGAVPAGPTLGVTSPPCNPSATVTVILPLKTVPVIVTVQVAEAACTYPLVGQPENASCPAALAYP